MGRTDDLAAAIRAGRLDEIDRLLAEHPELSDARVDGRSMLHHATDWPGHRPNVGESIARLVAAGTDPNVRFPHPEDPQVAETPLHWAASSNDVEAIDALLAAGAEVDVPGGIFSGCTPFTEAVIFEQDAAAHRLVDAGATIFVPEAAALGLDDAMEHWFDADGSLRDDVPRPPHWQPLDDQEVVDRAFQFACRAGRLELAQRLRRRGADPTAISPARKSALEHAEENGHDDVVAWLRSELV